MNPHLELSPRRFSGRLAELDFSALMPTDWVDHEVAETEVDFSDPTRFTPLAVLAAPHAAVVLAVAARPAYDDGTLHDWAWYMLKHNQLTPRAVGRGAVAGVGAVVGEAVQPSDLGPMVVRFAFFEDGGRLLNVTLTAPELFADTVLEVWLAVLKSFTLEAPRGSRFAAEPHPDDTPATPLPEPWLDTRPSVPPVPAGLLDAESGEPLLISSQQFALPAPCDAPRTRLFDFALCDDSLSLDDDHELNVRLARQGAGRIPDMAGLSDQSRQATLAAASIGAELDVPYGWHVFDDGRRTLILEPSGQVTISLDLLAREGRSLTTMLDGIEADLRSKHPGAAFVCMREGSIDVLRVRSDANDEQAPVQHHLLHPCRDDSCAVRAQVMATPVQAGNACNLAALILQSCVFADTPADDQAEGQDDAELAEAPPAPEPLPAQNTSFDNAPAWWFEALALEAQGQLDAAEAHIRASCPYIGYACATADMYRQRMGRLMACGDAPGALEAFLKSSDFIWRYASMATSGGEGAALSMERDAFRAQLVSEYGSDPEAVPAAP